MVCSISKAVTRCIASIATLFLLGCDGDALVLVDESVADDPIEVVEQPVVDDPIEVVEEPVVDDPIEVVEAPVVDDPIEVVEEPVVDDPIEVVEEPVVDDPIEVVEEPVADDPIEVAEDPIPDIDSGSGALSILIFTETRGFRHNSIPNAIAAMEELAESVGMEADRAGDSSGVFTDANLAQYDAVVWASTTGDVLNNDEQAAFERYIRAGGGYMGIHAASDTEFDWPWYGELVGAYFDRHPRVQQATQVVERTETTSPQLTWEHCGRARMSGMTTEPTREEV